MLSHEQRIEAVTALLSGQRVQVAAQLVNTSINTVLNLLVRVGTACARFQNTAFDGLPCSPVQEFEEIFYHPETEKGERTWIILRVEPKAFLKKLDYRPAALSLHLMHYNFVRIHQTLRITPAMAAGVTDRVWEIADIVKLLDDQPESISYSKDAHYGPALGFEPRGYRK